MPPTRGSTLQSANILQRAKKKRSRCQSFWKNSLHPHRSVCMCCSLHPGLAWIIDTITLYSTNYFRRSSWVLIINRHPGNGSVSGWSKDADKNSSKQLFRHITRTTAAMYTVTVKNIQYRKTQTFSHIYICTYTAVKLLRSPWNILKDF